MLHEVFGQTLSGTMVGAAAGAPGNEVGEGGHGTTSGAGGR